MTVIAWPSCLLDYSASRKFLFCETCLQIVIEHSANGSRKEFDIFLDSPVEGS